MRWDVVEITIVMEVLCVWVLHVCVLQDMFLQPAIPNVPNKVVSTVYTLHTKHHLHTKKTHFVKNRCICVILFKALLTNERKCTIISYNLHVDHS